MLEIFRNGIGKFLCRKAYIIALGQHSNSFGFKRSFDRISLGLKILRDISEQDCREIRCFGFCGKFRIGNFSGWRDDLRINNGLRPQVRIYCIPQFI